MTSATVFGDAVSAELPFHRPPQGSPVPGEVRA